MANIPIPYLGNDKNKYVLEDVRIPWNRNMGGGEARTRGYLTPRAEVGGILILKISLRSPERRGRCYP